MFLHIIVKIRIVKSVSSQRQLELRVRAARKHEETVFVIHKNLVMLQQRT